MGSKPKNSAEGVKAAEQKRRLSEPAMTTGPPRTNQQTTDIIPELEELFKKAPVGLCLMDKDLRFVQINERLAAINGFPVADHIGKSIHEMIPEIAEIVEPIYRGVIESGKPVLSFEVSGVTSANPGVEVFGLASYYPIKSKDGEVRFVGTVLEDITDRKRIERDLCQSEERFRTIYENAPVMVDSFDDNGRCTLWNRECQKLLGYKQKEINDHPDPLSLFYPDPQIHDQVFETIKKADGVFREYNIRAKDGSPRVQMWADFRLPNGELISVGYDITELRRGQQRQADMTEQLKIANEELAEFAQVVSHDLKTPLNALSSNIESLWSQLSGNLDRRCRQCKSFLTALGKDTERLRNLIDEILESSRLGTLRDKVIRVNLHSLVLEIIKSIAPPENINIKICKKLPTIWCERIRIYQVFQNIIVNAIEQNDKPVGRIVIDGVDEGDYWRLSIRDNGPGIKQGDYAQIFERFYKANPKSKGTGLGLATVKKIIQKYGGEIWVESEVGRGTTFFFTLPK